MKGNVVLMAVWICLFVGVIGYMIYDNLFAKKSYAEESLFCGEAVCRQSGDSGRYENRIEKTSAGSGKLTGCIAMDDEGRVINGSGEEVFFRISAESSGEWLYGSETVEPGGRSGSYMKELMESAGTEEPEQVHVEAIPAAVVSRGGATDMGMTLDRIFDVYGNDKLYHYKSNFL